MIYLPNAKESLLSDKNTFINIPRLIPWKRRSHKIRYCQTRVSKVPGQKDPSDAFFTSKVPIFTTTLSHCAMSIRIYENICPCISKPIDNMKEITESLNIIKWWRKGCLSIWYSIRCHVLFVWYRASYKNLGPFHTTCSWRNCEQWRQLWFFTLLLVEIWISR